MINGIIVPTTIRMDKMLAMEGSPKTSSETSTGKFGSVLASLTARSPMEPSSPNEPNISNEDLAELLQVTSVEELIGFLEENGLAHIELPKVVDGHLIFHDDKLLGLLAEMMPNLKQFEVILEFENEAIMVTDAKVTTVSIRELLKQLEILGPEILANLEQGTIGQAHLPQNEAIALIAVLKMAAIEGPKLDLTLKQEHQLHSLQEMLKSFGEALTENIQSKRKITLPFMETNVSQQLKVQASELSGQTVTHSNLTSTRLDGGEAVNGTQQNSRAEELMRELQNVFKRSNLGQTGGTNRISVRLYPEHLGQLRIELLQTNGVLTARILASSALGKEMLENHLHQLRNAFFQQNIQVERIDISQMLNETPHHEREQSFGQQFKQEQENTNEQNSDQSDENHMTFEEYMIELEV